MTKVQQVILRVVKAADNFPQLVDYDEYVKTSKEHKEWADAFNELREYADSIKQPVESLN